jgi:HlyD family secretion protein
VRPGQGVRAGDLLATVSRPELHAQARQAEAGVLEAEREVDALRAERDTRAQALPLQERRAQADLRAAEARLALVRAGSRPEEIERAESSLQAAQAELERLKAGARPQEIAQAEAAVRDARANRDALQKDAARKRALVEKGIAAQKELERAEADLAAAQAGLETKEQALDLLKAGFRPEEIRAQESRVREVQAQVRQARAGSRPEEIREAEAAVAAAEAALDQAKAARSELRALESRLHSADARAAAAHEQARAARETAARTAVRAPLGGVVVQVLANPGDGVSEQSPVAVILNRSAFRAVLEVPAAHRAAAAPGTLAEISVPGLPGVRFAGVVRALVAQANPETGSVPAEVWITDPGHRLAEGMAVNAQLRGRRADRRLFVPASALFAREGEHFVYRLEGE